MSETTMAYPSDAGATIYLLTVRGAMAPATVEQTRTLHNQTAGHAEGVAAARALGDLSHNVYTGHGDNKNEVLFLDFWNSLSGMGTFFGDPHVQAGGNALFAKRDNPVWTAAADFGSYHLATPHRRGIGGVGLLRVAISDEATAAKAFRAYAAATINHSRRAGHVSHSVWLRLPDPEQALTAEVIGVDTWLDADEMVRYYDRGLGFAELGPAFAGEPDTSVWRAAEGDWVEW